MRLAEQTRSNSDTSHGISVAQPSVWGISGLHRHVGPSFGPAGIYVAQVVTRCKKYDPSTHNIYCSQAVIIRNVKKKENCIPVAGVWRCVEGSYFLHYVFKHHSEDATHWVWVGSWLPRIRESLTVPNLKGQALDFEDGFDMSYPNICNQFLTFC